METAKLDLVMISDWGGGEVGGGWETSVGCEGLPRSLS